MVSQLTDLPVRSRNQQLNNSLTSWPPQAAAGRISPQ